MLYQKDTKKLQACWHGLFQIDGFGGSHNIFYKLKQFNRTKIKGIFYGNHLKLFTLRRGFLVDANSTFFSE